MSTRHGLTALAAAGLAAAVLSGPAQAQEASASGSKAAVAAGRSQDGRVAFRLEGRMLTATLARRIGAPGAGGRPSVKLVCGEEARIEPGVTIEFRAISHGLFVARGRRDLRVRPGITRIRAQLDRDVAAAANWCGLRWRGAGADLFRWAPMRLRGGTPAGCVASDPRSVVVETDRLLVTSVGRSTFSSADGVVRGCLKPRGSWTPLDDWASHKYGQGWGPEDFAVSGTWVAWEHSSQEPSGDPTCALRRRDLSGGQETQRIDVTPAGPSQPGCARELAIGTGGTLAWIAGDTGAPTDQVNAVTYAGRTITLATGPARSLTDVAVGEDGRTVTWREGGVARSATQP